MIGIVKFARAAQDQSELSDRQDELTKLEEEYLRLMSQPIPEKYKAPSFWDRAANGAYATKRVSK